MRRGSFFVLFALSGAAALVYEVVWTRLLTLQVGHGLAAASTVLAAFMGGLAIGAAAGGRIGQRLAPHAALRAYAGLEAAIAAIALLLPFLLAALRAPLAALYDNGDGGLAFAVVRMGSSLLLLSLPAAAMGATFPIASRWMVRHASSVSADAGRLYAANTLGAAAGALLAGFVLLPVLGLWGATLSRRRPQPGGRGGRLVDLHPTGRERSEPSDQATRRRGRPGPQGRAGGGGRDCRAARVWRRPRSVSPASRR